MCFRLSSVHKRATPTVGSRLTCGNKRDRATARGRKAPSKLGLAVKGKTFRVAAYYTARKGKTAPLCGVTSVMHRFFNHGAASKRFAGDERVVLRRHVERRRTDVPRDAKRTRLRVVFAGIPLTTRGGRNFAGIRKEPCPPGTWSTIPGPGPGAEP